MSDAGERPTFFRGAEFSRLVILAGLVLAGIPLAIYYGYAKPTPPPPERAPIAAAPPPLPPPDSAPELEPVLDDSARNLRDDEPLAYLFAKVRKGDPTGLAKQARRELLPANLLASPKRYRGLPVRMEGYATTVFAVDDVDPDIAPSGRFYEVWFYHEGDDQERPCVVLTDAVPKTLPGGRALNERVAVEGYFLKLQKFSGGNGKFYHAPMLVGRIAHDPQPLDRAGGRGLALAVVDDPHFGAGRVLCFDPSRPQDSQGNPADSSSRSGRRVSRMTLRPRNSISGSRGRRIWTRRNRTSEGLHGRQPLPLQREP